MYNIYIECFSVILTNMRTIYEYFFLDILIRQQRYTYYLAVLIIETVFCRFFMNGFAKLLICYILQYYCSGFDSASSQRVPWVGRPSQPITNPGRPSQPITNPAQQPAETASLLV